MPDTFSMVRMYGRRTVYRYRDRDHDWDRAGGERSTFGTNGLRYKTRWPGVIGLRAAANKRPIRTRKIMWHHNKTALRHGDFWLLYFQHSTWHLTVRQRSRLPTLFANRRPATRIERFRRSIVRNTSLPSLARLSSASLPRVPRCRRTREARRLGRSTWMSSTSRRTNSRSYSCRPPSRTSRRSPRWSISILWIRFSSFCSIVRRTSNAVLKSRGRWRGTT